MMLRRSAIAATLLLAACSAPTGPPDPIASRWSLNAWAGDDYGRSCRLSGDVGVDGSADDFAGTANLGVTLSEGGATVDFGIVGAVVRGTREAVEVGRYRLVVKSREPRLLSGIWSCDGLPGAWYMGPPVQSAR